MQLENYYLRPSLKSLLVVLILNQRSIEFCLILHLADYFVNCNLRLPLFVRVEGSLVLVVSFPFLCVVASFLFCLDFAEVVPFSAATVHLMYL